MLVVESPHTNVIFPVLVDVEVFSVTETVTVLVGSSSSPDPSEGFTVNQVAFDVAVQAP